MNGARIRQALADLRAAFWLRPAAMTLAAVILADLLVRLERVALPDMIEGWLYAGGLSGARAVLATVAGAVITVAGTTFSITVAALTLASQQMGPRLLRNFRRDPQNQYVLGAFVATFAYALVALRAVHDTETDAFVPQLAVSVGLLLAFGCVGALIWFVHHVAAAISVDRVVALVAADLDQALREASRDEAPQGVPAASAGPAAPLCAPPGVGGYLRVLDEDGLADWAAKSGALIRLRVRPGGFVFPGSCVGEVTPPSLRAEAETALHRAMSLGDSRSVEQDPEFAVRQLVEVGLRALSPSMNDPFTAIAVLDRLGAALCCLAGRWLADGRVMRDGRLRLDRGATDYAGLVDAMFHMLREAAMRQPAVVIRLLDVLGEVGAVEHDASRRGHLRRHVELARSTGRAGTEDASARDAIEARRAAALAILDGAPPG